MTTLAPSRPLRSLAIFMVGWVLIRAITLWFDQLLPGDVEAAPSVAVSVVKPTITTTAIATPIVIASSRPHNVDRIPHVKIAGSYIASLRPTLTVRAIRKTVPFKIRYSDSSVAGFGGSAVTQQQHAVAPPTSTKATPFITQSEKRWSASGWLLIRDGGSNALGNGGELGGSQAGVRLSYDLASNIAATARISRPLARAEGGEASVGVAIRHRNVGLLLERRIALDRGGRNDFSITAYAGVSDIPVGKIARLDGYAQAGIVGTDKFVDGAVRIERTAAALGPAQISVGAGAWGGAQPGVERVDVGPQIVARFPVGGRNMRVSAEWRERVLGNAAPISGPSVTIGIDL
ncbi:MAG: hypothetical protein ABI898_06405 [Sphingomonadales bacterium]